MYEAHYRLQAKPFTLLPDPEFLYLGARHKTALSLLEYGLVSGSSFIVITGEPGTGKTTLLNWLLDRSHQRWTIGVLSNTHGGLGGLLPWVVAAFGLETKGRSEVELFHEFGHFLEREGEAGRRALLVLDEAQNVGPVTLEELRLLSNLNDGRRRSLQILLSGQPGLRAALKAPRMEQFAQRIGLEYSLEALSEDETVAYIDHRLRVAGREMPLFTTLARRIVYRLSGGIPRLVNQLCDHALVYGYAAQAETITARIVLDASITRHQHGVFPFRVGPGEIHLGRGDLDDEERDIESFKMIAQSIGAVAEPKVEEVRDATETYRRAIGLKQAGEYRQALTLFEALTEDEEWATKALAQKCLCLKAMGRYDEALAAIRAAAERTPLSSHESASLRYLLARTLEADGRYREAVEVYRALKNGRPSYRDVAERLARLSDAKPTWFEALRRGCGQLLRTAQG